MAKLPGRNDPRFREIEFKFFKAAEVIVVLAKVVSAGLWI